MPESTVMPRGLSMVPAPLMLVEVGFDALHSIRGGKHENNGGVLVRIDLDVGLVFAELALDTPLYELVVLDEVENGVPRTLG